MDIQKSTRHSRITGDFAEALVLYWLSRDKFECARLDHTGIDLLARNRHTQELMGISVKSRSRKRGTATEAVSWSISDFVKAEAACREFKCSPWYAVVVDGCDWIKMFLTSLEHLNTHARFGPERVNWCMTDAHIDKYRRDPEIRWVEWRIDGWRWWESPAPCNDTNQSPKSIPTAVVST